MSLATHEFEYLRELVHTYTGIALEAGKHYLLEARLLPVARNENLNSLSELVGRLRSESLQSSALHHKVAQAMTTNETSFFRDLVPFDVLRQHLVPALVERRAAARALTIWSAACSSGQEPYSIAMLLREHFPQLASWNVRIVATDISAGVLAQAREGRYSQLEVNRGLPARMLARYFEKRGGEWFVKEDIRRMVDFRPLNLVQTWSALPATDVVFLRNVLIYFDVEKKKSILRRLRHVLRSDGYLFLGGAETTMNVDEGYERVDFGRCGCYRLRP